MLINRKTRENDALYAAIVESSNDAIIGKDLDGTILSWNKGAEKLYGFKAKEIVGLPIDYIIPPDRRGEPQQFLKKIRDGESIKHFSTIRLRRDGTEIKVSISISPIKDDSGKIIGAASIAREIPFVTTEQKKFELAVESAPNGMLMINAAGDIKLVNEQLERMFGYTRDELLDKPVEMLVPERFRQNHPHYRKDFFKDQKQGLWGWDGIFLVKERMVPSFQSKLV
ncbi:PAS domain-containing protein [Legionella norrlandica]|uniref:PAS domain-containing protein n=1 Tax=Legionella norrlandica TaxID=1498499 RepID=UPI000568335D|nr:PAS domain S-box protein [Legionella norrlandica]